MLQGNLDLGAGDFVAHTHQGTKQHPYRHKVVLANNETVWQETHCSVKDAIVRANDWSKFDIIDCYIAPNGFSWKAGRTSANVAELSSFYVDLDYYKVEQYKGLSVADLAALVLDDNPWLPMPTVIVDSGTGCWFVWTFKRPLPINQKTSKFPFLPTWQTTQDYLVSMLARYGADPACSDAARVMRLPGTINSKTKRQSEAWETGARFEFNVLRAKVSEEYHKANPKRQLTPDPRPKHVSKGKTSYLFNWHTLAYARMQDFYRLAELRGGRLTDNRRMAVYAYAVEAAHYCRSEEALKAQVSQFINDCIADPKKYGKSTNYLEVVRRFGNRLALQNAGVSAYQIALDDILERKNNVYNHSTRYLLRVLDITPDEQGKMKVCIGSDEKLIRLTRKRRKAGILSRPEYLAKAEKRRQEALRLRDEGLSQRLIADRLGVGLRTAKLYLSKGAKSVA
jgi:hypothetical protein